MRPGLADTDDETAGVHLALLRRATPARRLELALSLSQSVMGLSRRGLARRHPGASETETDLLFISLHYGASLAEEVRERLLRRS